MSRNPGTSATAFMAGFSSCGRSSGPALSAKNEVVKVGDRVICVDAEASFQRLAKGAEYTVETAYDGTPTVIVRGAYHSVGRFVLAAGTPSVESP